MGTTAPMVKAALVKVITDHVRVPDSLRSVGPVQVLYGVRASQLRQVVMAVTDLVTEVERPRLGGQPRSRQETHVVTVRASVSLPIADQQVVTELAYSMIDQLAEHLRAGPGGPRLDLQYANLDAWVSSYELNEYLDDAAVQDRGRVADVTAQVTVIAPRI